MNDWGDHMLKAECGCCYIRNFHNQEFKGLMKNCTSCAKVLYDAKCISLEFGDLYYFDGDIKGRDETLDIDNEPRYVSENIASQYCMTCNYKILNGKCSCYKKPSALKFDDNKPSFYCLPPAGLLELGKIEAIGVAKYGPHSYRAGIEISRYMNAIIRHYLKFMDGEDCDPIDTNSHLGSIAWNALAAIQTIKDHPELDDRYRNKCKNDL